MLNHESMLTHTHYRLATCALKNWTSSPSCRCRREFVNLFSPPVKVMTPEFVGGSFPELPVFQPWLECHQDVSHKAKFECWHVLQIDLFELFRFVHYEDIKRLFSIVAGIVGVLNCMRSSLSMSMCPTHSSCLYFPDVYIWLVTSTLTPCLTRTHT